MSSSSFCIDKLEIVITSLFLVSGSFAKNYNDVYLKSVIMAKTRQNIGTAEQSYCQMLNKFSRMSCSMGDQGIAFVIY